MLFGSKRSIRRLEFTRLFAVGVSVQLVVLFASFCFLLLTPTTIAQTSNKQVIKVVNNEVAPFIYRENGRFTGPYYERLTALFNHANLDFDLQLLPWPRVYKTLLQEPDTMVVSIGRTPKRENQFKWIGAISETSTEMYYYKLKKNDFDFSQFSTSGPYITGVLRDTYYEEFVEQQQFDKSYYYAVLNATDLMQMMFRGRVDVVILSEKHVQQLSKDLHFDIKLLEKFGFAFSVSHFIAFGKNTSQSLVDHIRHSFEELERQRQITHPH